VIDFENGIKKLTMITVADLVKEFKLEVFCGADKLQAPVKGAYSSDLLSDVMGKAVEGDVWITMQTHRNIIAVASLKELAAILIINGGRPEPETLASANSESVILLGTKERSFTTCGKLYKFMERDALV
jgi:predicted transcriptional regulator